MQRAAYEQLKLDARHLALDIGLRPAARALGLGEERVKKWAQRGNWMISAIHPVGFNAGQRAIHSALKSPEVPNGIEVKLNLLRNLSDRTKLGFALGAVKASEHLADLDAPNLIKPGTSISADTWSKVADRTHGWSAERTQAPTVQIANLVMPTDEDRAQRREIHKRLDDIAQKLARTSENGL